MADRQFGSVICMNALNIKEVTEECCSGCGACKQKCPKKCISMVENKRGFLIPTVDGDSCIRCGICMNVCPEKKDSDKCLVQECYIAKARDSSIQLRSTSGGVFSLIAERVIEKGGVVYGCAWTNDLLTRQKRITTINEIEQLRQSKYVQSDTEETFAEVKRDLDSGKTVLYSGTGCQLAGLKNYVGVNHEDLILVEMACHGVPSPGLFGEYIKRIERETGKQIKGYTFRNRNKHKKGEHYQLKICFENGSEEYRYSDIDPYYSLFISGRSLRETCYSCRYKGERRVGDILLADFWGCEKEHHKFNGSQGASAVACVTTKGVRLLQEIEDDLDIEPSSWGRVTAHNNSLMDSASCQSQDKLMDKMEIEDFHVKMTLKKWIKIYTPERIKYYIKRF